MKITLTEKEIAEAVSYVYGHRVKPNGCTAEKILVNVVITYDHDKNTFGAEVSLIEEGK